MSSEPKPYFTVDQYLAFQASCLNGERYEYEDGYLYPLDVAGPIEARLNHAKIAGNLFRHVGNKLEEAKKPCRAYTQNLEVQAGPRYAFPDLIVTCGKEEFVRAHYDIDVLANPLLLGEVLSPSTADYDRGGKFQRYRLLPSFREYLIVHQDRLLIEQHSKQENGDWLMHEHRDPLSPMALGSLPGISLSLADIYNLQRCRMG